MGSISLAVHGFHLADGPSIARAHELANLRRDPCLTSKKALNEEKTPLETNNGCRCSSYLAATLIKRGTAPSVLHWQEKTTIMRDRKRTKSGRHDDHNLNNSSSSRRRHSGIVVEAVAVAVDVALDLALLLVVCCRRSKTRRKIRSKSGSRPRTTPDTARNGNKLP